MGVESEFELGKRSEMKDAAEDAVCPFLFYKCLHQNNDVQIVSPLLVDDFRKKRTGSGKD